MKIDSLMTQNSRKRSVGVYPQRSRLQGCRTAWHSPAINAGATIAVVTIEVSGQTNHDSNGDGMVTNLKPNTTYYWKVVADDGKGGLTESDDYSFTRG